MRRLLDEVCLVTGAAQGIGLEIAEAFLREGARVLATDINISSRPAEGNGQMEFTKLDVTNEVDTIAAAERHPNVSVLVNCAGYVAEGTALECSDADLLLSLSVNVRSIANMVRAFLPGMKSRRYGSIINIASVVSHRKAVPRRFAYAASKAAVVAMTKSIAVDYVRDGIRCNSISPGTIDTPSLAARLASAPDREAAYRDMVARQPLGRLGRASEVAEIAVLLASREAAFMTGADLVIDGGMSL